MDLKEEGGITMDEDGEEDADEEAEDQELRAAQDQGQDIEMVSGDPKNVQVALAAKGPTVEQDQPSGLQVQAALRGHWILTGRTQLFFRCPSSISVW